MNPIRHKWRACFQKMVLGANDTFEQTKAHRALIYNVNEIAQICIRRMVTERQCSDSYLFSTSNER